MANANQSRSDNASRAEEPHQSDISALCALIGSAERHFTEAERHQTRRFGGFRSFHDKSYATLCEGHLELLCAVPNGSDLDLLILAGHASLMADQVESLDVAGNAYAERLTAGVHAALISICGSIANRFPEHADAVAALWPELGQSIRNDAAVARQMIAEAEGR